ncbi:hypothetical protein [Streptomyces pseudovenezuelae]|uniref:Uncharacterized protein n=1 Tax=Streptomyces pseudovenezuelae TaxID=67350 RepID=A0ABT6M2R6_9ACTN|nr:hypothetical protein [Streptomyces pseudovenezuelae]MDH6222845.1 hypothetical protein [Streptomyces pseudovenezuelae]
MSEYQDHVRQSLDGQHRDPSEDLGRTGMRWSPAPLHDTETGKANHTAATAHALIELAREAYLLLVGDVLSDGTHHLVASARTPDGLFTEGHELTVVGGLLILDEDAAVGVTIVIAAAMVGCSTGGLVVRTFAPDGSEFVRGWGVRNFWLRPLTAEEVRAAYTVGTETGATLAPEPGVEYRQAERVPRPQADGSSESTGRTAPPDNRPPNRRD